MLRTRLRLHRLEERDVPAGAYVAVGDVLTSNPGPEIVTGAGDGGGPLIRILRPSDQAVLGSFFAYEESFRGGVQVATGDLDGDGIDEIVAGTGVGGGPRVIVFSGAGKALSTFFAYESTFRGGVQVSTGDFDGDGRREILTGTGVGGGPAVKAFDPVGNPTTAFFAYENSFRGGVLVTGADLDGDGQTEILTGTGVGGGPVVRWFNNQGRDLGSFLAFDANFRGGVYVGAGDLNSDGQAEIVAAPVSGAQPEVRQFNLRGEVQSSNVVYDRDRLAGLRLAVAPLDRSQSSSVLVTLNDAAFDQSIVVLTSSGQNLNPTTSVVTPPRVVAVPPPPVPSPSPNSPPSVARAFSDNNFEYYQPSGLIAGQTYPLLVAFSPGGDPNAYANLLRPLAEKYKIIIAGSKFYRNSTGPNDSLPINMFINSAGQITSLENGYALVKASIEEAFTKVPADPTRVILHGFSGGASFAHAMSLAYPGLADALIINTGMIWGDSILGRNSGDSSNPNGPYWNRYVDRNTDTLRSAFQTSSRKLAVLLQSPTDFRYEEMQADRVRLQNLGFSVNSISFSGGHTIPSGSVYDQALAWITSQPTWQ